MPAARALFTGVLEALGIRIDAPAAVVQSALDAAGWTVGKDGIREKTIGGKVVKLKLRYITNQRELRKNVQAVVQQQWLQPTSCFCEGMEADARVCC